MQNLPERLSMLMKQKGISQVKLAERAEVSTTTVSNLLSGRKMPNVQTIYLIAEALDIDIRILFTKESIDEEIINTDREKLLDYTKRATPEQIRALLEVAKSLNIWNE